MRRSRRQRQKNRSRRGLVFALAAAVLVAGWFYAESKRAGKPEPGDITAPATNTEQVIPMPLPGAASPGTAAPAITTSGAPVEAPPMATMENDAAREASWAASRREAIRIQQELRAKQAAEKATAARPAMTGDTRCVDGQRMKRVENGWVQDGDC